MKTADEVMTGIIVGLLAAEWTIILTRKVRHKAAAVLQEEATAAGQQLTVTKRPRWPIVVGVFYLLAVIANTPAIVLGLDDVCQHGTWGGLAVACVPMVLVMLGGALLLLSVRVPAGSRRLPPLRHIAKPVAATIILLLVLSCGLMLSLATAIKGDDFNGILCLGLMGGFWLLWSVLFFLYARKRDSDTVVTGALRLLFAGSVLELLVGVTSHILLRQRNVCCAPMFNFWGMTMGLSIMFIAFGPGIVFLYLRRFNRKKAGNV